MKWLHRATRKEWPGTTTPAQDQTVATLTARADLILEELDTVVKQMGDMLREKAAQ